MSNPNDQTNELCGLISESSVLSNMSVVQKRSRNPSSYSQIRYLMKKLTSALDKRLKGVDLPSIVDYAEQKSDHYFVRKKKNFTKSRNTELRRIRI